MLGLIRHYVGQKKRNPCAAHAKQDLSVWIVDLKEWVSARRKHEREHDDTAISSVSQSAASKLKAAKLGVVLRSKNKIFMAKLDDRNSLAANFIANFLPQLSTSPYALRYLKLCALRCLQLSFWL
jgi:hypothetical protein